MVSDYISLLQETIPSDEPFIAVDCEWRKHLLDVIQLGTPSVCMVIQIHQVQNLNVDLRNLLTNPSITKVFKGMSQDIIRLKKMWDLTPTPVHDIGNYFKTIGRMYHQKVGKSKAELGPISHPLSVFSAHGYTLLCTKGKKVTMSNWSSKKLTNKQIEYAALDAFWIAFNYYLKVSNNIGRVPRRTSESCFSFPRILHFISIPITHSSPSKTHFFFRVLILLLPG
ncbi:hypothetical protein GEMRC1_011892 [Eukaryota sp. GEM-RC1]